MAVLKVARLGNPILRERATAVPVEEIGSPQMQRLIDDLIETMYEYDGAGLAAPQVRVGRQVVVYEVADNPRYPDAPAIPLTVLVNPRIRPLDEETEEDWEGCLSVPELRGRVPRLRRLRVEAYDRSGQWMEMEVEGFHARVIQHELDHLNGKVFLDRMPSTRSLAFLPELLRHGPPRP